MTDSCNLICDQANCGRLATVFGLKGSTKEKCCEEHILALTRKEMTIYTIAAFNFIQCTEDVTLYETRRKRIVAGVGNLGILSSFYEAEVRNTLENLEKSKRNTVKLVEEYYTDLTMEINRIFEETREVIEKIRGNFDEYLMTRNAELGEYEEILCSELKDVPGFLRKLLEFREEIKGKTQEKRAQIDWRLVKSLRFSHIESDIKVAGNAYLEEGASEKSQFRYERSLKLLSKGWNLLKKNCIQEKNAVVLGLILGEVLCLHFAKYDESEEVFRKCLEIEEKIDPNSTDISRIKNWLCANYYYSAKYGEAENLALQVLQSKIINAEDYWPAVYYLSSCHLTTGKANQTLIQQYLNASVPYTVPESRLLRLCSAAMLSKMNGLDDEAESLYWEAQSLGTKHCPTSILTVDNCYQLGKLYDDIGRVEEAMRKYTEAQALYLVHYPASMQSASTLYSQAVIYTNTGKLQDAEIRFLEAHSIFAMHYTTSLQRANNLRDLAALYMLLNRYNEAECIFLEAEELYSTFYPLTLSSAINYTQLTKLYHKMSRLTEAIEKGTKGQHLCNAHFRESIHHAESLLALGNVYFDAKDMNEAENMYKKALKLFKKIEPNCASAAFANHSFGRYYREKDKKSQAEKYFLAAYEIYSKYFPGSLDSAENMLALGLLCLDSGKREAGISFLQAASECWRKCGVENTELKKVLTRLRSDAQKRSPTQTKEETGS